MLYLTRCSPRSLARTRVGVYIRDMYGVTRNVYEQTLIYPQTHTRDYVRTLTHPHHVIALTYVHLMYIVERINISRA